MHCYCFLRVVTLIIIGNKYALLYCIRYCVMPCFHHRAVNKVAVKSIQIYEWMLTSNRFP